MSLINAVKPIITSKTASVRLEIAGTTDGRMSVIARPIVGAVAQTAPQELHALCAALATPIKVVGDPQEIEKALADAISEQSPHRQSWAERASELEAQIAAAAKKDASTKKGTTASNGKKEDAGKGTGKSKDKTSSTSAQTKDSSASEPATEQSEPAADAKANSGDDMELNL